MTRSTVLFWCTKLKKSSHIIEIINENPNNRLHHAHALLSLLFLLILMNDLKRFHRNHNIIRMKLTIDEKIVSSLTERAIRMPILQFHKLVDILSKSLSCRVKKRCKNGKFMIVNVTPIQIIYIGLRQLLVQAI